MPDAIRDVGLDLERAQKAEGGCLVEPEALNDLLQLDGRPRFDHVRQHMKPALERLYDARRPRLPGYRALQRSSTGGAMSCGRHV